MKHAVRNWGITWWGFANYPVYIYIYVCVFHVHWLYQHVYILIREIHWTYIWFLQLPLVFLWLCFFRRNLYYIILGDGSFPFSFVISWAYTCKYKPSDYWGIFPSWYYHSSIVLLKSKTSSLRRRRPGISCTDWKMRCPVLWRLCNSTSFGSDEDHGSFDR